LAEITMPPSPVTPQPNFDAQAPLPPIAQPPRRVVVRGPVAGAADAPAVAAPGPADNANSSSGVAPQVHLPGSKYYTLRYLLAAALADGESVVVGPALSDDTAALVVALRALGAELAWERADADAGASGGAATGQWALRVRGCGGKPRRPADGVVQAGNAGAVLRLLLGIGALLPEVTFVTNHPESLGRRPNADLLAALRMLGLQTETREPGGLLPITLRGGPPHGGAVSVSGARSSQYLSALLYLAPLLPLGLDIAVVDDLRSAPLVRATLRALAEAGVAVTAPDLRHFVVVGGQAYRAGRYVVPGDTPSAAALAAAALTLGAPLHLTGLAAAEDDLQAFVAALTTLGAPLTTTPTPANHGALTLDAHSVPSSNSAPSHPTLIHRPPSHMDVGRGQGLGPRVIDGDACIDSVPALVAAACFVEGETRFERVATLRLKESDRIGDLCAELGKAGCDVTPLPDTIIVRGRPQGIAGGVEVDGHDDHRLIQALAIVALRSERGLTINGADAIAKSYPWFFDDLVLVGGSCEDVGRAG